VATPVNRCHVGTLQQEALIHQLQDQHYMQYMQQCYNQQLLQQQLSQQQVSESTAVGQSPAHTSDQQQQSPARSNGASSTPPRPDLNLSASPQSNNQKHLPNGLQTPSDADAAADALLSSDLADDDADADPSEHFSP